MKVKLPIEIHYYYELTPKSKHDRLLYCIPQPILEDMVENNKILDHVLDDYPLGVDIKVSQESIMEFEESYRIQLGIDPELTYQAFQAFKSQWNKKYPKTGVIDKIFLEDIVNELLQNNLIQRFLPEDDIYDNKQRKQRIKTIQTAQNRQKQEFKELEFKKFDPDLPIQEQSFAKVKMSEGTDPLLFFAKIKENKKGNKK